MELPAIQLFYVLVIRLNDKWQSPLIISQFDLRQIYENFNIGSKQGNQLLLYFRFDTVKGAVSCSGQSFKPFVDNWGNFPVIPHL